MSECLDDISWGSLKSYGQMALDMFRVGDYKTETLKDGQVVQFRIIGFNHDRTKSGVILPFTWEMCECLQHTYPWQETDTNKGSWAATWLRHQMNDPDGLIYKIMPDEIIQLAVPAVKLTATEDDLILETEDKFWIKSERELFGRNIFSHIGEGYWYEYYRQEGVPWGKKCNGGYVCTMLRSPRYYYASDFCGVRTNGSVSYYRASDSYGIAPAFSF